MMKIKKTNLGFTLVEIIVIMAIIAILAILVIRALTIQTNKANDAKRKADLQKISIAFENYYSDEDCYPPETILSTCGGDGLKPYLDTIPCDPVYHTPYCYLPIEPNTSACYQKYRLLGTLKYLQDLVIKSLGCDSGQFCGWETECAAQTNRNGYNYGIFSLNTSLVNPNIDLTAPTSTPIPNDAPGVYACAPDGSPPDHAHCNSYPTAQSKGCYSFSDPVLCQQRCDESSIYWCY